MQEKAKHISNDISFGFLVVFEQTLCVMKFLEAKDKCLSGLDNFQIMAICQYQWDHPSLL